MVTAAALTLRAPVVARPLLRSIRPARRICVAPRANALSDVGKYLSEAASQIFYPQENDTPWKGSGTPFVGKITHHEETSRLRQLAEVVASVKKEMEASGEVDISAAATEVPLSKEEELSANELQEYMTQAVARLFGHNFKGDENEPKEWLSAGYKSSWRRGSRREVQRQYNSLVRFEKVVKKTLQAAEEVVAKK